MMANETFHREQYILTDKIILDYFRDNAEYDYQTADLQRGLNLSYKTIRGHLDILVKDGKIEMTRKIAHIKMYQLKGWLENKRNE